MSAVPAPERAATFASLGLPEVLVRTLARRGMHAPFAIQTAALPDALAGRDVLGRAQTGSGKTLAFGLPLLTRLAAGHRGSTKPRGLVLVPTRELAMQVHDALAPLGQPMGIKLVVVVGGAPMGKQISALRAGVDIVIATPGRLEDLIEQRVCDLSQVEIAVLDEADHMADLGFLPPVRRLLDQVRPGGQRLLFSATLDSAVQTLVNAYLVDAVTHETTPVGAAVTAMAHHLLVVTPADRAAVVAEIASREGRTLMFVRTKHGADRLTKQLRRVGVSAGALHGGKTQAARTRTLADFREGRVPVLVATDVAARGIHVDDVDLVVHVDPAADHKDYLHRAGRTARAGASGTVVTLVSHGEERPVAKMTRLAGVRAQSTRVAPGASELSRVTGSRVPSGVAIAEAPVAPKRAPRPARPGGAHPKRPFHSRRSR
ncbi:MAG TPA: DEAD/DEAH box helicase [Mycobacteriales bacterium]|nr:DEAD/DEAH box helicase [Mycobacteriales bacterium]